MLLFYTPWKHQKTFTFADVFRGYRKATLGCNGLIVNDFKYHGTILRNCFSQNRILYYLEKQFVFLANKGFNAKVVFVKIYRSYVLHSLWSLFIHKVVPSALLFPNNSMVIKSSVQTTLQLFFLRRPNCQWKLRNEKIFFSLWNYLFWSWRLS